MLGAHPLWALIAVACLIGCAPPAIAILPPRVETSPPTPPSSLEVCALIQERLDRPLFFGVDESTTEVWHSGMASVLVKHPAGWVVIDPAIGTAIADDLSRAGLSFAILGGSASTKTPLVSVMAAAGLDAARVVLALATHLHWDHVGALRDLPNASLIASRAELRWAKDRRGFVDHGVMRHHLAGAHDVRAFDFTATGAQGFAESFDLYGDGAIVAVPLPGHTPGSTGFFVRGAQATYFFIGDTTWTMRGVEAPAHKNRLIAPDEDSAQVAKSIAVLHALARDRSDLIVVPAHDLERFDRVPPCRPTR